MLKFRINRKRQRAVADPVLRDPGTGRELPETRPDLPEMELVPVDDVPLPEPVAEESHIGYNKAGRAYDRRTGRLIKPADLASHEI